MSSPEPEITAMTRLFGNLKPPETRRCESHGDYTATNYVADRWSACPICTQIERDAEEKRKAEKEAREMQARIEAWIGRAGIPPRFRDRTLEAFVASTDAQRRALEFCQAYVASFADVLATGRSAIFTGRPGTGKTHLAAAIGAALVKNRRSVVFTSVFRAVRRVKDSWRRDSEETETEAVAAFVDPDLLILDEVGVQFGSETEKLLMFDILNERYENRRPVLLLTNLPVKDAQAYLGERIFDRLREDGGEHIPFDWESYRGRHG